MIRPYRTTDVVRVVELGKQMHAEGPYQRLLFDVDKVIETLSYTMTAGFAMVGEVDGRVEAFGFGHLTEYSFSRQLMLVDHAFYVTPEHRGKMLGLQLLKAYIKFGTENGATEVLVGGSHGFELGDGYPKKLQGIVGRLGFRPGGTWFKLRVVDGPANRVQTRASESAAVAGG
jgi:GNAT superfamily N-acetyltransferase